MINFLKADKDWYFLTKHDAQWLYSNIIFQEIKKKQEAYFKKRVMIYISSQKVEIKMILCHELSDCKWYKEII